ncbi:ROK family protein [Leifsonia sp. NPDC058292]|uniref:ROK family protein n=1 Tax=Leifsonia sp. NPDC058292 TaxID=3346428 RepID=UPI0036DDE34D
MTMAVLCIDFGGTEIKLGTLEGADIIDTASLPNTGDESDLTAVREVALRMPGRIDGVGIAVPGVVDRARGALVAAQEKYEWATGRDLRAWAATTFDAPAVIENDARAALLGETAFGCASGATDAVLLTLGTGVGTAAIVDGVLLRGAHDHAGILGGHITVDLDGPVCNCGNIGCAEAIASTWALRRDAAADPALAAALGAPGIQALGIKSLIDHSADPLVAPVLDRFVRAWGAAIVGLCHAYDPSVVVVSGGVMRSADILLPRLTRYVHDHLWSSSFRPPLLTPDAPEHSVLLGLSAAAPRKDQ